MIIINSVTLPVACISPSNIMSLLWERITSLVGAGSYTYSTQITYLSAFDLEVSVSEAFPSNLAAIRFVNLGVLDFFFSGMLPLPISEKNTSSLEPVHTKEDGTSKSFDLWQRCISFPCH